MLNFSQIGWTNFQRFQKKKKKKGEIGPILGLGAKFDAH